MANPRDVIPARVLGAAVAAVMACGACVPTAETGFEPRSPGGAIEGAYEAPSPPPRAEVQDGNATWYGAAFAGRKTASGEPFNPLALTAAHRTLPFGTWVDVRRADTGRSIRVRINDRGPWGDSRKVIDLSHAAASELGIVGQGVAPVELRVVRGPT